MGKLLNGKPQIYWKSVKTSFHKKKFPNQMENGKFPLIFPFYDRSQSKGKSIL
jgi:hypothetical protein